MRDLNKPEKTMILGLDLSKGDCYEYFREMSGIPAEGSNL